MNSAPDAIAQARAALPALEEELRLAQQSYEAAANRLISAAPGTTESRTWQRHTSRWRNTCALLATRLNRARATAEGRAWLRAV